MTVLNFIYTKIVAPIVIAIVSLFGISIPSNTYSSINTYAETYEFDYSHHSVDSLFNGISWVNSAVKQDGFGFKDFDIVFKFDRNYNSDVGEYVVTLNQLDPIISLSPVHGGYFDYLYSEFDNPVINLWPDEDIVLPRYVEFSVKDNFDLFNVSFAERSDMYFYWDDVPVVPSFSADVFFKELALSLVDRDINTGFIVYPKVHYEFLPVESNDWANFEIEYNLDITFPSYSYFNSYLVANNTYMSFPDYFDIDFDNFIYQPKVDYTYSTHTDFYNLDNLSYPLITGNSSYVSASGVYFGTGTKPVPYSDSLVNVFTVPDDVNIQGDFRFSYATDFYCVFRDFNDYLTEYSMLSYSIFNSFYELNFFSDDPVVGGFYGGGNVEYENVAWYDVFGHLRNFTKWVLFDSFIYDSISPLLDPIYSLLNSLEVLIYNVLSIFGFMDPYYQEQREFLVEMLFNLFMIYVVIKLINFFT